MSRRTSSLVVFAAVLLFASSSSSRAFAQVPPAGIVPAGPGRVLGGVVSGEDGRPLVSAAVTVRSAVDSSVVTGVMTAQDGKFRVEGLPLGQYRIRVSMIGHTPVNVDASLTPDAPLHDVGVLRLAVAAVQLEGVEATAQRSPIVLEADRTVYDTKDMPAAAGGTAADVLRQVDELEVDFNGKVTLRGNQSVAIHLNGRPAPMKGEALERFLTQLSGKMIAKIEVVPNPSAKHDPEGMGGIVNIVLKDNVDLGLSGSFGLNGDTRGSRGLSARLAYQKGRFTFFGGGSASLSEFDSRIYDLRQNLITEPVTFIQQEGTQASHGSFGFGDFSAEFKLARQTILWANGYGSGSGHDSDIDTRYDLYDDAAESRTYLDRYARATNASNNYRYADYGLGVKHQIVPQRHELNIDLRRGVNGGANDQRAIKQLLLPDADPSRELTLTDSETDNPTTTLRVDYTRPWRGAGRLEVGASISRREMDERSELDVYADEDDATPRSSSRTGFVYEELFRSVYLTASQTFGKLSLTAGVRGEFATTSFWLGATEEGFDNGYNSVFPNVNASYQLGSGKTMRIGYSKRVGRPPTFYLNPYRPTVDPLNRYVGNPHLEPNYTHSVNADFSWIGQRGTLRIAPYFRRTVDNWTQIRTVDEQGVSTTTYENIASLQTAGSNFTLSLRPQGRLGGSVNFSVFHVENDGTNLSAEYANAAWRWSMGSNLSLRLTGALNATANANYSPPRDLPQGRYGSSVYSTLGLRQQLFGQKATVNLFMSDPLDLYTYRFETRDRTHIQLSRTTPKMRRANLSITYNFGKPPQQNSRRDAMEPVGDPAVIR